MYVSFMTVAQGTVRRDRSRLVRDVASARLMSSAGTASQCEPFHAYSSLNFVRLSGILPMFRALSEIIVCMIATTLRTDNNYIRDKRVKWL